MNPIRCGVACLVVVSLLNRVQAAEHQRSAVLLVIANQDFFYREYSEPRAQLEQAGFRVVVAAARNAPCRPHSGTGEGSDGGVVNPDLAIAEAKAKDYQPIVFAGGWGASMYQPTFPGVYVNPAYNGDPRMRAAVNRLVQDFVAQDKHIVGICHGVSVLAWARVNNRSLLAGQNVSAPPLAGPEFLLNQRRQQLPSRWNAEANGARVQPSGSVGRPGSTHDDVTVAGRIITAEDDRSARECGRILAERLKQR